jgi:hypothetical protein
MIAAERAAPPPSTPVDLAPEHLAASPAAPRCVARLVPLGPGLYAFRLAAPATSPDPGSGLAVPAVQVCQPPGAAGGIEISDAFGGGGSWLGRRHGMLFVSVPAGGAAALVTAYLADAPVELEICHIGAAGRVSPGAASPPLGEKLRLVLAAPNAAPPSWGQVGLEAVAYIRGRGAVRFVDAPWVGRLGRGLWIEALTLAPGDPAAAMAIEYKGLTAGGAETPWTPCGAPCGTQGGGLPLIGIAVRQKTGSGNALFDCEYTGYFQSGATAGPDRNGAPCRSALDGDPLEGLQLRITRRPPPSHSARA